jgi:hypothetical protein
MSSASARGVAYSDLVGGLLDARVDAATQRFDAELIAAVEAGAVTTEAARRLRFWQRASVRGVVDHARTVLPPALEALDSARDESKRTVLAEQRSWAVATGREDERDEGERRNDSDKPDNTSNSTDLDSSGDVTADPELDESASSPDVTASIDLTDPRSRLLVAGLTQVRAPTNGPDRPS